MRHVFRVLNDPDEYADAVSGMDLKVGFQRRQERPAAVEQFQTPGWALDFGEVHAKTTVRGVLPGGWASMCFVRGPADSTWNGQDCDPGMLCCVPPGEELDGRTAPGFQWMTVALPPAVWAQSRALAGLEDRAFDRLTVCPFPPAVSSIIQGRVREVYRLLREPCGDVHAEASARSAAASLALSLATMACETAGRLPPPRDSLRNRTRLARRAEEWMRAHLADEVQIPDVCLALGVSRRELEYAFRTTFDQSPRDFLHALRLHAIRRVLVRADGRVPILPIALDHGITHPSRFAADYRALFGERPSETLRR